MDDINDKIAMLHLRVATVDSKKASLEKASADFRRDQPLVAQRAVSQQEMDKYTEAKLVSQAELQEALQAVYEIRPRIARTSGQAPWQ